MMFIVRAVLLLAAVPTFAVLCSSVKAQSSVDQDKASFYKLEFALAVDGEPIGSPRLTVKSRQEATVVVAQRDGDGEGFRITTTAEPAQGSDEREMIRVETQLFQLKNGEWTLLGEPTLLAFPGQAATILVNRGDKSVDPSLFLEVTATKLSSTQLPDDCRALLTEE